MTEGSEKWTNENSPSKGPTLSTSTSSFEALDPHDPNLSRLATAMFQKTSDYLNGELSTTEENYYLLEQMNRTTISKYADLKHMSVTLGKTINDYNTMFETTIKPVLMLIDQLEQNVKEFETAAYRLDHYTKQLKAKFKEIQKDSAKRS